MDGSCAGAGSRASLIYCLSEDSSRHLALLPLPSLSRTSSPPLPSLPLALINLGYPHATYLTPTPPASSGIISCQSLFIPLRCGARSPGPCSPSLSLSPPSLACSIATLNQQQDAACPQNNTIGTKRTPVRPRCDQSSIFMRST